MPPPLEEMAKEADGRAPAGGRLHGCAAPAPLRAQGKLLSAEVAGAERSIPERARQLVPGAELSPWKRGMQALLPASPGLLLSTGIASARDKLFRRLMEIVAWQVGNFQNALGTTKMFVINNGSI